MTEPGLPVIIETDVCADVDDVGALALVHEAADRGAARLLAIGVNTPSRWGHRAVAVINRFFDRPVPLGILDPDRHPPDDSVAERDYARLLATRFPGGDVPEPEPAVVVHRRALAAAEDGAVTVVSLGFLTNLAALLDSPGDRTDARSGSALVAAKVCRLVIMGGRFPEGREFNFEQDVASAVAVLERWPTPVDLLGFEVGAPVISGARLSVEAADTPVGAAYRAYCGPGNGRESWDPLTAHLALTDDPELFAFSAPGRVRLEADGTSRFAEDPTGRHRIVRAVAGPERMAAAVDERLDRAVDRSRPHGRP
ncbi:inosine-uridine nucleoside N-ribohydrolase [Friedmanniella endophytica]|uniref:Inosine-uridine nucleoside N-ribohydrolase n=1 Tax=Microlunatus kandeliicorticis TaxID=1759536 RepID=A0A7W3IS22_9ACTN|nr:nucleoside hydrolase [Microlunatus kandeliicorticis]MBA8794201.1 inosine-uridine nucleoside N-ribohydrolase [Microlunatus kandeliicorticis]